MLCVLARWVLPISSQPIVNGEVEVDGSGIKYIGPERTPENRPSGCSIRDLGDSIVLPGLVNVHSHVEYTVLRGFLEDVAFFPWIRALIEAKTAYSGNDWLISAQLGALECIASGITTLGDNSDTGITARVASELGMRARVYQEVFGIDDREPWEPQLADLDKKLTALSQYKSERVELGVSPHAIYTVRPELMRALVKYCDSNALRTSVHIAESAAESQVCETGTGPFAEMYSRRGITWKSPGCSPTRYLQDLGVLNPNTLAVHCVQHSPTDIELTAKSGASIAHCPKSNAKLGVGTAPLADQLAAPGLSERIGLGTDSAVSNNTHDLFEEMRFGLLSQRASKSEVILSAEQMVQMATLGGATALGWQDRIGSIETGKVADLIAVRLDNIHNSPMSDPYAALVYSCRADDVCLTMVDGRILYEDGRFMSLDAEQIRKEAAQLRQNAGSARA